MFRCKHVLANGNFIEKSEKRKEWKRISLESISSIIIIIIAMIKNNLLFLLNSFKWKDGKRAYVTNFLRRGFSRNAGHCDVVGKIFSGCSTMAAEIRSCIEKGMNNDEEVEEGLIFRHQLLLSLLQRAMNSSFSINFMIVFFWKF